MSGPRLALTAGDPAGIGPEIVLKALSSDRRPQAELSVYGPAGVLEEPVHFGLGHCLTTESNASEEHLLVQPDPAAADQHQP